MKKEKLLKKIIKKAKVLKPKKIEQIGNDFLDVPLETIGLSEEKIYFNEEKQELYTKTKEGWHRFKILEKQEDIPQNQEIIDWCKNLYDYVNKSLSLITESLDDLNSRINHIEESQEEGFKAIIENVNLKIKLQEEKCKEISKKSKK